MSAIARLAGSLVLLLLAAASAANGQNKVPAARPLEALVKSSLLTFNDANVTGNYTVLHARISKPFAQKFPPDKLKEAFKDFNEKSIDIDVVSAMTPVYEEPPMPNPPGIDTPTTGGGYLVTEERIGTTKVIATLGFFDRKEDALVRARRRIEELKAQLYRPVPAAA